MLAEAGFKCTQGPEIVDYDRLGVV